MTLLHELAHICVGRELPNGSTVAAHGKEFAGIYLFLVKCFLGNQVESTLFDSMKQHKVKVLDIRDTIGTP